MALLTWILSILRIGLVWAVGWIKSGGWLIISAVSIAFGLVYYGYTSIGTFAGSVLDLLYHSRDHIREFMSWCQSQQYLAYFYNLFALDVFFQSLLSSWGPVIVFVISSVVVSIIGGASLVAPLLIWRVASKLISANTGGLVKS